MHGVVCYVCVLFSCVFLFLHGGVSSIPIVPWSMCVGDACVGDVVFFLYMGFPFAVSFVCSAPAD